MQEHQFDTLISGRYRLLKRLRRGGMSEVFLAFDEQEEKQVALKIVMNSDGDCIKRLQREVHILRTLSHPHILPLLGDGVSGSYYYQVMPYMERGNLRERLAQRKLTAQEAGIILHQLTDALSCAHSHGVIHRDIKPSNILLDSDDATHIYLADFGIAKIVDQGSDLTQTGFLVGTPEFMAPELAEKPESASSDIYATGVLLYQMLTGQLPFTGTTPLAVCWKHIKEQPAPPSSLNPDISPAIEQVILRAMHKNPLMRFADAGALSLAFANALNGIDEMPDLHTALPVDIPVLPPPQVTLSKAARGFATTLPARQWQPGIGRTLQRGILGIAAAALLVLPVSLGFMVARNGAHLSQPVAISRAFVNTTTARVTPLTPITTTLSGNGAGFSGTRIATPPPQTGMLDVDQPIMHPPAPHHPKKHKSKKNQPDTVQPLTSVPVAKQPVKNVPPTAQPVTDFLSQTQVQQNPVVSEENNQGNGPGHQHNRQGHGGD